MNDTSTTASVHEALQDSLDAVRNRVHNLQNPRHSVNLAVAGISAFIHIDTIASTGNA